MARGAEQRVEPGAIATCVVGTAGHIDHGKSSLVRALTGRDPDRLKEEQAAGEDGGRLRTPARYEDGRHRSPLAGVQIRLTLLARSGGRGDQPDRVEALLARGGGSPDRPGCVAGAGDSRPPSGLAGAWNGSRRASGTGG